MAFLFHQLSVTGCSAVLRSRRPFGQHQNARANQNKTATKPARTRPMVKALSEAFLAMSFFVDVSGMVSLHDPV